MNNKGVIKLKDSISAYFNRYWLFVFLVITSFSTKAQSESFEIVLPWSGNSVEASLYGETVQIPAIPFEYDDNGGLIYVTKRYSKGLLQLQADIQVNQVQYENASSADLEFVNNFSIPVPKEFSFNARTASDRGKEFLGLEIAPFVLDNNQLKRIKHVSFTTNYSPIHTTNVAVKFVTNSAMSSGSWYKIAIPVTGAYRIDYNFLLNAGIPVNGLNPNHIHIFGNGMGMLPEANNVVRPDDLVNNAIFIEGDTDGSFDAGDYIVFYAQGPDEVRYTSSRLTFLKNIYTTQSYYYICIDNSKVPNRVQAAQLSDASATHTISGTDQLVAYEKDERKYDNYPTGKRWYSELFDFVLEHSYNFNLAGLQTNETIELQTSFANTSTGSVGGIFRVFLNNGSSPAQELATAFTSPGNGIHRVMTSTHTLSGPNLSVRARLDRTNPSLKAYMDKIEINYRRSLQYGSGQYIIRDLRTVGMGNIVNVSLSGAVSNLNIWEITNPRNAQKVNFLNTGNSADFRFAADSIRQFVAFNTASLLSPTFVKQVPNQNLHALSAADYLIVTHKDFLPQANRLAVLHREDGWMVHVVDVEHVYNEFSSGMQDPVAIRYFAKMFYDRAANAPGVNPPLNLCLFGDGSYDPLPDRSSGNNNMIVTYQTLNSESYTSSITSDGFFVLLDENESFNGSDGMDMGVGRLIATTPAHAKTLVDKIEHYKRHGSNLFNANSGAACQLGEQNTRGDWQLTITHIADDEDGGQFVRDHEGYVDYYAPLHPQFISDKIYLDAYTQFATPGGQRFPDVPPAIKSRIDRGNLIMNYVGHGGETGLAYERVVTIPDIESWDNINKMMLFVSATCEFTRFDDFSRVSAGELLYLSPIGGAVSMMTTTRAVFISVNSVVGEKFYEYAFLRDAQLRPITMGEIAQGTLNASGSSSNRRAFMLLGDPMLRLNLPKVDYNIVIDSINGFDPALVQDTLKSLSKARIVGHLEDQSGNLLTGLNGFLVPTVFDKPKQNQTLGQDPGSPVISFETQLNALFKGKSTVQNGQFSFEFIVPKDIDYSFGNGKMVLYFYNQNEDGADADIRFLVGGVDPNGLLDNQGPDITMYLNDENFVSGGLTNETPIFYVNLFDENGINAVGNGIGHDITLVLDNNTSQPFILNDYYESDLDTYQSGKVRFQMPKISPGPHTLTFKVWDVNNNSSEETLDFVVLEDSEIDLSNVLNYPNPFTTQTEFFFEHNQPGKDLEVQIQIFTISGKVVKTLNHNVLNCGFRSTGIMWDGKDDFGDQLARGTYIYRVSAKTPDGEQAEKFEKLVLLK